jgi:predicted transcriptional regulator
VVVGFDLALPLADTLARATSWPPGALAELAAYAAEIEATLAAGEYRPTDAGPAGIDRGVADARAGRFATDEEVAAVFALFRGV